MEDLSWRNVVWQVEGGEGEEEMQRALARIPPPRSDVALLHNVIHILQARRHVKEGEPQMGSSLGGRQFEGDESVEMAYLLS